MLNEVCVWIDEKSNVLVSATVTPNITDSIQPARIAINPECEGVFAINTIMSVMAINQSAVYGSPHDLKPLKHSTVFLVASLKVKRGKQLIEMLVSKSFSGMMPREMIDHIRSVDSFVLFLNG